MDPRIILQLLIRWQNINVGWAAILWKLRMYHKDNDLVCLFKVCRSLRWTTYRLECPECSPKPPFPSILSMSQKPQKAIYSLITNTTPKGRLCQ